MQIRIAVAVSAAAMCLIAQPEVVEACSCGGRGPTPAAFRRAAAVFVGTVEGVTGGMPKPIVATFRVTKVYRGRVPERVVVAGDGTNCDVSFVTGVIYLVYAVDRGGALATHKCTRTRGLPSAEQDVRYLETQALGSPQAILYGNVFRRITTRDGNIARQALVERLEVVAVGPGERRSASTDEWGPYEIVLPPGEFEVWVERAGRRVSGREKVRLAAGDERRLSLDAEYRQVRRDHWSLEDRWRFTKMDLRSGGEWQVVAFHASLDPR